MPSCISATNLPRTLSHFHTHQNQKFRLKQKQNFKNYLFSMRVHFKMGSVKGAILHIIHIITPIAALIVFGLTAVPCSSN